MTALFTKPYWKTSTDISTICALLHQRIWPHCVLLLMSKTRLLCGMFCSKFCAFYSLPTWGPQASYIVVHILLYYYHCAGCPFSSFEVRKDSWWPDWHDPILVTCHGSAHLSIAVAYSILAVTSVQCKFELQTKVGEFWSPWNEIEKVQISHGIWLNLDFCWRIFELSRTRLVDLLRGSAHSLCAGPCHVKSQVCKWGEFWSQWKVSGKWKRIFADAAFVGLFHIEDYNLKFLISQNFPHLPQIELYILWMIEF